MYISYNPITCSFSFIYSERLNHIYINNFMVLASAYEIILYLQGFFF